MPFPVMDRMQEVIKIAGETECYIHRF